MKKVLLFSLMLCGGVVFGQVSVGSTTPDASAQLDVVATNKGMLVPRVALTGSTDVATIASPATSLLVYNTATAGDVVPGFHYWDGTKWQQITNKEALQAASDLTKDAWVDNAANTRIELGTKSDGTTARDAATEVVVTDAGNLGIGTTNPLTTLHVVDNSAPNAFLRGITSSRASDDITGAVVNLGKSRGTETAPTALLEGDFLGAVTYGGFNGTTYTQGVGISGIAAEDFTATGTGTDLGFGTTSIGSTVTTGKMRLTANGNLGIGTETPNERLEVNGKVRVSDLTGTDTATDVIVTADATTGELKEAGTVASVLSTAGADTTTDSWSDNETNTRIELGAKSDGTTARDAGTEVVVTDAGNFGIGTTNPLTALHVVDNSNTFLRGVTSSRASDDVAGGLLNLGKSRGTETAPTALLEGDVLGAVTYGGFNGSTFTQGVGISGVAAEDFTASATGTDLQFGTTSTGSTITTEKMRLTANGNLGIGTNTPNEKLEVNGKVRVSDLTGTDAATDVIVTADATTGELKEAGTVASVLSTAGADTTTDSWTDNETNTRIELGTKSDGTTARDAGTEVVVTDSGNFGIGTTNPFTALHVVDNSAPNTFIRGITSSRASDDVAGGVFNLGKSRGTETAPTAVLEDDTLGAVTFGGFNGSTFAQGVGIAGVAAEDFTASATGTDLEFGTTSIGSTITTKKMTLTANGNLGIGTDNPLTQLHVIDNAPAGSLLRGITTSKASNNLEGPLFNLGKSRGTSSAPTAVLDGDVLGQMAFAGFNGATFAQGVGIAVVAAEDFTPNAVGSKILFNTSSIGDSGPTEKMRLSANGNLGIGLINPVEKLHVNGTIKATDINFTGLPVFADEAAATAGGLSTGDCYRTATGELRIKL